jgi:hypothetical protein
MCLSSLPGLCWGPITEIYMSHVARCVMLSHVRAGRKDNQTAFDPWFGARASSQLIANRSRSRRVQVPLVPLGPLCGGIAKARVFLPRFAISRLRIICPIDWLQPASVFR